MSAWESTRTPSLRKSASRSIIALRNNSESPILSSSATVHSPSVDWSLLKEPHGGRLRQRPLPFTHSRGHYQLGRTAGHITSEAEDRQQPPQFTEARRRKILRSPFPGSWIRPRNTPARWPSASPIHARGGRYYLRLDFRFT